MRLWKVDALIPMISSSGVVVVLIISFLPPNFVLYGSGDGWEEGLATFGYKLDMAVVLLYFWVIYSTMLHKFWRITLFQILVNLPIFFITDPFVYVEIS
jgi:hypothetical protein